MCDALPSEMRCPSRPLLFLRVLLSFYLVFAALYGPPVRFFILQYGVYVLNVVEQYGSGVFFCRRALVLSLRYCAVRSFFIINVADSL